MALTYSIIFSPSLKNFMVDGGKRRVLGAGATAMQAVANKAVEMVKDKAPVKSGTLKQAITATQKTKTSFKIGFDRHNPKYGKWVLTGHPNPNKLPMKVKPKVGGELLHFYWKKIGKFIALPFVWWRKPVKANNFIEKTMTNKKNAKELREKFFKVFKKEFVKIRSGI